MLSSPYTLIYLCLGNDNFDKAHEVIQVYKMQNTYIAQEIDFIEKIQYLKLEENNADKIIKYCADNVLTNDKYYEEILKTYKDHACIKAFVSNEVFINIIDVTLTLNKNYTISKQLIEAAYNHNKLNDSEPFDYLKFCNNVNAVFKRIGPEKELTIPEILCQSKYPLHIDQLLKREEYYREYTLLYKQFLSEMPKASVSGIFHDNHSCEETFQKLSTRLCGPLNVNYLNKLYNYLKILSEILHIKSDNSNIIMASKESCIFNLISKNAAEIVGNLLLQQNVQPKDLEKLFTRLKLDIVYKIAWNCLPEIELKISKEPVHFRKINSIRFGDILNELNNTYLTECIVNNEEIIITPDKFLLSYMRKRNWLLAYLINKIYLIEEAKPDTNSDRTKYFNNLLKLESIQHLKVLYKSNNAAITVLFNNNDSVVIKLLQYINNEITTDIDDDGCDSFPWKSVYDLINSIPENILFSNDNLILLKDLVIFNLIQNNNNHQQTMHFVKFIQENDLRRKCILCNLENWQESFCIDILESELARWDLNDEDQLILREKFHQIKLYEQIKNVFQLNYWYEVHERSIKEPENIFSLLLTTKQVELLLKWVEIHKPISIDLLHLISLNYFLLLLENNDTDLEQIKMLLDLLQFDQRIHICKNLINQLKKLEYYEFIINYLVTLLPELESEYKNALISLKIFSCFNGNELEYMFCLIHKPLIIIEQLIMNVRLEKLELVLQKIMPLLNESKLKNIPIDISVESIDYLLRNYANKALDFRGIQPSVNLKSYELKLMQSLDTVSLDSDRKTFVMPVKVPDKLDWIQNEQALECMCCREVTFSMFNRRHHCRRCGRVICGNCSHKRMEIPEYGSIPVRVCNDCFKQSHSEDSSIFNKSEQSSNISSSLTGWVLTDDAYHNNIAREEFSYEYAPSVSLCLSILKVHSKNVDYSRFLLQQCKTLLPYLQDTVSEIDLSFVIQMIKSLVTVAKMISLHHSFTSELDQCNEILLHIELLSLLVEKDCLDLLRNVTRKLSDFEINSGTIRRLRDKLLEQEQWPLALEISTKVGLDKTGIFAAWGKSYLKAGALQMAREKFQYCLEKNTVYEASDLSISVSYDQKDDVKKSYHRSVTLSTVSENRPMKTPPLVNEIISVLEANNCVIDKSVIKSFDTVSLNSSTLSLNTTSCVTYDPAVCILSKLKNLNAFTAPVSTRKNSRVSIDRLSQTSSQQPINNYGGYSNGTGNKRKYIEPIFYTECLYYLIKYASHTTILHFYVRHNELDEALNYLLENNLHCDYFIEIYLKCLENGKIEQFQEHLQKIDCTLNSWEIYLRAICRHLETNAMFNVLYHLQLFMCDYVRAAMTCIKFYQEDANSFKELLDREEYLFRAQNHLKQELEQEQWVQVTRVRTGSTASSCSLNSKLSSTQPSLIMKIDPRNIDRYINTIWRQIEISKFLAECEIDNRPTVEVLNEIYPFNDPVNISSSSSVKKSNIPTLFESQLEKTKLAVMAMVCGKNVEEGFGIAFRIIQDHNLKHLKIYCLAGKYLAQILRETAVIELINCIKSSGLNMEIVCETCDEVLLVSVCALLKANGTGVQLENLIKFITDPGVKIDAYIESKQLKRAYLLAIKYNRINDIKKILREAERHNQPQIKAICMKRLNQIKL